MWISCTDERFLGYCTKSLHVLSLVSALQLQFSEIYVQEEDHVQVGISSICLSQKSNKIAWEFVLCNHNPKIVMKHLGGLYNFLKAVSLWAFCFDMKCFRIQIHLERLGWFLDNHRALQLKKKSFRFWQCSSSQLTAADISALII